MVSSNATRSERRQLVALVVMHVDPKRVVIDVNFDFNVACGVHNGVRDKFADE